MKTRYILAITLLAMLTVGYLESPAPGESLRCDCILDEDD